MKKTSVARRAPFGPGAHAAALAGVVGVTLLAFWPVLGNEFVNWDDPTVLLRNEDLTGPHVVRWAFSTTLIGHYQPLAWIVWAAMRRAIGLDAAGFHAVSLLGHALNAILVYVVAWRLTAFAMPDPSGRRLAALGAALAFAVHPVRVEAVAWASALPYILSTAGTLVAVVWYLDGRRWSALAAYATALLIRPVALALPLVLLAVDIYPIRRRIDRRVLREKLPFALLALAAGLVESRAREVASVQDIGLGARLSMAVAAPFEYLGRTAFPAGLSPLDPLPILATVDWTRLGLGAAGLAGGALVVWRLRRRWPALAVAAAAYVLLLAPVAGLIPSGLQATADRYMYLPGVALALLAGIGIAQAARHRAAAPAGRRAAIAVVAGTVVAVLCGLTWRQTQSWHDSIALWTRAADLHPRNDVATYNLAIALADAGREEEAIDRYEQTLRIVPDQTLARSNLNALLARRAEREGDRLADAGRLDEAERAYARALAADAARLHARAARGIVLSRLGRARDALPELRRAYDADARDAAIVNALAFALTETGGLPEAATILKRGVELHPDDLNLAHNLARLLATAPDPAVRDGALALRIAERVNARTHGSDPRVLDTLAAAYAATSQIGLARDTADRAAARARAIGDPELAAEIAAHARNYTRGAAR